MKASFAFALIITGILLLMMTYCGHEEPNTTGQHSKTFVSGPQSIDFLLYLPAQYNGQEDWPLIVYLHGASLRGQNTDLLTRYGLPRLLTNREQFPFVVLSPQCPAGKSWDQVPLFRELLDRITDKYRIDNKRIYLTGVSLGGSGVWHWSSANPKIFAAIAPLCGVGNPADAQLFENTPVWVFHGAKDKKVPVTFSDRMVSALRKNRSTVRYKRFPDLGHNIVERVYQNQKLYDWFLQQRRES